LPFDLPEAEQELVGGYHTEYFGIKLMLYLVGEYLHMVTAAFLIVILFLGGWHFWGITGSGDERPCKRFCVSTTHARPEGDSPIFADTKIGTVPDEITWPVALLRIIVLVTKVLAVIFFFMLARWSWPRFRYDQLMSLAWLVMLPLGMVNVVYMACWREFGGRLAAWLGVPEGGAMVVCGWAVLLAAWLVATAMIPSAPDNTPRRCPIEPSFEEQR
jgi:NADH-quinone oxidoreductase subunit H